MTWDKVQRRKQLRKRIRSPLTILLLLVVAFLTGKGALSMAVRAYEAYNLAERSVAERDRLVTRKSELKEKLEFLNTPIGVEAELRNRFGVVLPGEKVAVVVDSRSSDSTDEPGAPWWRWFWPF